MTGPLTDDEMRRAHEALLSFTKSYSEWKTFDLSGTDEDVIVLTKGRDYQEENNDCRTMAVSPGIRLLEDHRRHSTKTRSPREG